MPPKRKFKQEYYKGRRTGRSVLYELWDESDERSVEELAALADISVATAHTYRLDYLKSRKEECKSDEGVYRVREDELPLETVKGIVWCIPREGEMRCGECELYPLCKEAARMGWYLGCEKVLASELLPGYLSGDGDEEEVE